MVATMVATMVLPSAAPVPGRVGRQRWMPLTAAELEMRFPAVLLVEVTAADHRAAAKAGARSAEWCALTRAFMRAGGYGWAWATLDTVEVGDEDGHHSFAPINFVSGVYQVPPEAFRTQTTGTFACPRLRVEQWSPRPRWRPRHRAR